MIAFCWILCTVSNLYLLFLYEEDEEEGCRFLGWPSRGVQSAVGLYAFVINFDCSIYFDDFGAM